MLGDFPDTGGSLTPLSVIAHLPEGCRPKKRLTFNVNHHDFTHSVDVTPEGSVVWMDGHAKYTWVSLSGITFAPGDVGRITLPLVNGQLGFGNKNRFGVFFSVSTFLLSRCLGDGVYKPWFLYPQIDRER